MVERAAAREVRWLDRVRAGLVELLGFLDDEPGWARVLCIHAPVDGVAAFRCEQRMLGVMTGLMDDGSPTAIAEIMCEPQLTSEFVIGGVFSVIRRRMLKPDREALVELAPTLMSFIVRPYFGAAAANAELTGSFATEDEALESGAERPLAPAIAVTHRTTMVLRAIARAPRSSNREIAAAAGIDDDGQSSHLLRRLARRGLIEKVAPRSGSRRENAWLLTPSGRRVLELLGRAGSAKPRAAANASVGQAA